MSKIFIYSKRLTWISEFRLIHRKIWNYFFLFYLNFVFIEIDREKYIFLQELILNGTVVIVKALRPHTETFTE